MYEKTLLNHISVKYGDITREPSEAIVNAANPSLLGGGGVDGAIHKAAGPELAAECRKFGGCEPGEARITMAYNLKSKFVIHTPGPIYKDGFHNEKTILENSYNNSLKLAMDRGLLSIAFPAISTGVYNYPKKEACEVAVLTVLEFMRKNNFLIDVSFILFDIENYTIYKDYINKLKESQ